jgi:hypothetical protein
MKKLAAVTALGLMASGLFAQGLNPPSTQTKESWEEINFEFNSSILSDGYPGLLRLADLLSQHRDYHVKVTGNTDSIGSARYNDRLALARANAVRDFLVKYGANAGQVSTAGNGKHDPEVDNRAKEGRFMNRRVLLAVSDGQGRLVTEGGISDVLKSLQDFMNKQQECCDQILKRLDKLDDILAALKGVQGENDQLKSELADQRNQLNALKDQVNGLPKPLSAQQTTEIAHNEAQGAAQAAVKQEQENNKKFSIVGINAGPAFGPSRRGDFTVSGMGRFFSPFGGDGTHAVQAQGEYIYNPQAQEGQFDIGLVNRWGNLQAGAFGSFKYLDYKQYQNGGTLGQAAFLFDYIFGRGRVGAFGTQGFKNTAVLNSLVLAPGAYMQTYAQMVNQYGLDALVGVWGDAYVQGNVAYLRRNITGMRSTGGGELKLVQPITHHVAFTLEGDWQQTEVGNSGNGQVLFGVQVGNYIRPKDYGKITTPVPMDVPRIRYDFGTRRVGSSPPVANAGPAQRVSPGTVTLNGSASYDPLGEALQYSWKQISGPQVAITPANQAVATFLATVGNSYVFSLTVTNQDGLSSTATTSVTTVAASATQIAQFTASPASIAPGQSSTLSWVVQNATSVTISGGVGSVNAGSGSVAVSPTTTTTYTLTASGATGTVTQTQTVTVGSGGSAMPQIVRFDASPLTIAAGQQTTLSWSTNNATTVSISSIGSVTANGSTTVSPTQTTTYTLTATNSAGSVSAPITVTVSGAGIPQIVTLVATPQNISPGQSTKICWQVTGATSIGITPGVGTNLNANDCATVSPSVSTTYTLTATNAAGQIQGNVTVNVGVVQITSFTASPVTSTSAGNPVVLSWTTANATSVVLIGADIPPTTLPVNGSYTDNPITNETYTLTAYGPGGQTISATISVFVR